jgi:fibronectin type 3 domain-containing protein
VERSTDGGSTFSEIAGNLTSAYFTDTIVLAGWPYWYRVRAENNGSFTGYSNIAQTTVVPAAPTNVVATSVSSTEVDLVWHGSAGADGYTVLRQAPGSTAFVDIGDSTGPSFADRSTISGVVYKYEVLADNIGGSSLPSTPVEPASIGSTPVVVGRWVFYNDSAYDGNDSSINPNDDAAIAPDKQALLPGEASTFANFTSFSRGINGIMIDIANLPGTPTPSDFSFLVGSASNPSTWTTGAAPTGFLVRPGAGVNGSTRIEITWTDRAIMDEWLQVTVAASANTGLAAADVFSFGNLIGSSNATVINGQYVVTPNDLATAANDLHTFLDPAPLSDPCDFNRDGRVDATDEIISRNTYSASPVPQLQCILGAPGKPYLISAGGSGVAVGWPPASDPNVTSYDVYRVDGLGNRQIFSGVTGTTYTDATASHGTTYTYTVVSRDANGNASIPSAALVVTPSAASISTIQVQSMTEGGTLNISTAFTDPTTTDVHVAAINWGDGATSTATITESGGSGTLSASHPYLSGGSFMVTVTLTDQNGTATVSTFTVNAVPIAPSGLAAVIASDDMINLSWFSSSPSVADFQIQMRRSDDAPDEWIDLGQVPRFQLNYSATGLAPGTAYRFQIVAENAAGQSLPSNVVSGTTQPPPTPTINTHASASPTTVTGTTTQLSVGATDSSGGSDLIYTWTSTHPQGSLPPSFSDNGDDTSDNVTATFTAAGNYTFEVTVTDGAGNVTTDQVLVTVQQTATSIHVTPDYATVQPASTKQLSAAELDQFGQPMTTQPSFSWSLSSPNGTVSASGLYTAPQTMSPMATVNAAAGGFVGKGQIATVTPATGGPMGSADSGSLASVEDSFSVKNGGISKVDLGMSLNFYGVKFSSLYVGDDGDLLVNIANEYEGSSWEPFLTSQPTIAPFLGEIDLGEGGTATYGPTTYNGHTAWVAAWTGVRLYGAGAGSPTNTFSVTLVDRSDVSPGDFDIVFNYVSMNWDQTVPGYSLSPFAGYSNGTGATGTYYELPGSGTDNGLTGLSGTQVYPIRNPQVTLTPHRTGQNAGQTVSSSVKQSADPSQYVVLTDNDYQVDTTGGLPDYKLTYAAIQNDDYARDSSGNPVDSDLAKISLSQIPASMSSGEVDVILSDPTAVRLFDNNGNLFWQSSTSSPSVLQLNLSSPSGYLAGLTSGNVDLWLQGMHADKDFAIAVVYKDSSGNVASEDDVHINLVDWNFVDGYGNDALFLQRVDTDALQYAADNAQALPSTTINDPAQFVSLALDGLASSSGTSFDMSSDDGADTLQDTQFQSNGNLTTSVDQIGLYSGDSNTSLLTAAEKQTLQQSFHVDVVHNPQATITLIGPHDAQERGLQATPQVTQVFDNQVVRLGDKIKWTFGIANPDPKFNYEIKGVVAGQRFTVAGAAAEITINPTGSGVSESRLLVTITDKANPLKVVGTWADTTGSLSYILPAATSQNTLVWTQKAFAALQVNGDTIPAYPVTPWSSLTIDQFFNLNNRISQAYAQMYNKHPDWFAWSGLAAYTSSRGGQGIATAGILDDVFRGFNLAPNSVAQTQMYQAFTSINFNLFFDLYRQFIAYDQAGIDAIRAMAKENVIVPTQLRAWELINAGVNAQKQGLTVLATQDFWDGNLGITDGEQNIIAQRVFDNFKPLFAFLCNEAWFKTQIKSPTPGAGPNNSFTGVVPVGVNGGQPNVADKDDRWKWITTQTIGIWDTYKQWAPTHPNVNLNDVTNSGLALPWPPPTAADLTAFVNWRP